MSEPKSAELKAEVSVYISSFRNGSTPVVMNISSKDISPWRNKRFQCWVKESRIWNIFFGARKKEIAQRIMEIHPKDTGASLPEPTLANLGQLDQ